MVNTIAPMGFKPMRRLDGAMWNGQTTPYKIASGYSSNIFMGDLVKFLTTGVIAAAAAGDQYRGIFMGVSYTDTTGKYFRVPYWPASTSLLGGSVNNVEALVMDDPNVLMEAQFTTAGTPVNADKGASFNIAVGTGSTATGMSGASVDYSTLNTTLQQLRFLDFVDRLDNDRLSANSRGIFMPLNHDFRINAAI